MSTRRVYIEVDNSTDVIIKGLTKKSFMTNKDYQKFFLNLLYNAFHSKRR
jgi:hypothetical protein